MHHPRTNAGRVREFCLRATGSRTRIGDEFDSYDLFVIVGFVLSWAAMIYVLVR